MLSGRVWYSTGEPLCSVTTMLIISQGFEEMLLTHFPAIKEKLPMLCA